MKGSILVVDDDPEIRALITRALKKAGYSCEEASDGTSAMEMVQNKRHDIVFMDLLIPGLSGKEMIPQIKSVSPGTAVGVISIVSDEGAVKELFDSGAAVYITKPFKIEELVRTAENLIHKKEGAP